MPIYLIGFPPVNAGMDQEFREWFEWSNRVFARLPGFSSRRLLEANDEDGGYWAIVEHESEATFMAMRASPERAEVWAKVESLLAGEPTPRSLGVVISPQPATIDASLPRPREVVAVGATAPESISTQDDRLALVAELRLRAPKVRSVSIETLARLARVAPFSRNERVQVEPLVTLVLAGCVAAVRTHPSGGRRMIGIATPGDLVGLLSLGASDPCCELVGLTAGVVARWPGDLVLALAEQDAELALSVAREGMECGRQLASVLDEQTFDAVTVRVANALWRHRALLFNDERPLLSRDRLAELVGASREEPVPPCAATSRSPSPQATTWVAERRKP